VQRDVGEYLGERCGAAVVVDGIGDAEVYGGFERHGLDVGKSGVSELKLSVKQSLVSAANSERHLLWS
jgi:hypothetical protein